MVHLLIEAGDPRAVPVLKKLLSEERVYLLRAHGIQSKVEEFIASIASAESRRCAEYLLNCREYGERGRSKCTGVA